MSLWVNITRFGKPESPQAVVILNPQTGENAAPMDAGTKVAAVGNLGEGGTGIIGWLSQIWSVLTGTLSVEPLGIPTRACPDVEVTITSVNTELTATARRISITALKSDMRFSVGNSVQTATTASHFIQAGQRLDIAVPLHGHIAVIRDGASVVDGILCISELA